MSLSAGTSDKDLVSEHEHADPVSKIMTSGENNEFIHIGNKKYHRYDLMEAFGGTLNPGLSPYPVRQLGNPSPLGLCGFAMTTFVLSMFNARAMGITVPNVVVGLAVFYGGFAQFAAGIWEGLIGNTFAMCALTSYGSFWLAFAAINIKAFGIKAAYTGHEDQLGNAVSFFLLGWTLFTFMLTLCTIKSTVAFFSLFFFLTLTFIFLTAGDFTHKVGLTRTGGVLGVITAFIAFYNAFCGTASAQNSYITGRPIRLPWVRV